jgi:hypothetical protein
MAYCCLGKRFDELQIARIGTASQFGKKRCLLNTWGRKILRKVPGANDQEV